MALAARSLHDQVNSDNSVDARYPFGTKPAGGAASLSIDTLAFAAAAIDLTNRPQNTAVSINYRTYLQGSSAATAILSVNAVSGALGNWSTPIDSLINPGTSVASGSLQVSATDGVVTVSFPVQSWSFISRATSAQKWTPGWWMELDNGSGGGGLSGWLSQIAAIKNEPNIVGVVYRDYWRKFEDDAGGTYVRGFTVTDQLNAACANAGKKFSIAFLCQSYDGTVSPSTGSKVVPTYFETLTCADGQTPGYVKYTSGPVWSGYLNLSANLWDSVVMDKFIAMTQGYAARYESNPTFVLFHGPGETSIGVPSGLRSFSIARLATQFNRWVPAARAAFPTTMLRYEANWYDGSATMQTAENICSQYKVIVGGPDIRPSVVVNSNTVFNGSTGTKDFRGKNAFCSEIQQRTMNGYTPTNCMPTLFNFSESGAPAQGGSVAAQLYMVIRNTWNGAPNTYALWDANILPFIRANPVPHTAYPSEW